jgi:nucleoid DNA-binding protein
MNQELKKNKTFKFFNFGKFFLTETKSKNIRKIYSKEIIKSTPKKKIKFNASKKNKF